MRKARCCWKSAVLLRGLLRGQSPLKIRRIDDLAAAGSDAFALRDLRDDKIVYAPERQTGTPLMLIQVIAADLEKVSAIVEHRYTAYVFLSHFSYP